MAGLWKLETLQSIKHTQHAICTVDFQKGPQRNVNGLSIQLMHLER